MSKSTEKLDAWQDGIAETLAARGRSKDEIVALLQFDAAIFRFHRRMAKGELMALALRRLGLKLEPAQFQALTAVARIQHGVGREASAQPTIGLIAEEMALDPSRASRIVADLVRLGCVQRGAAQDDGRKSVIKVTDAGLKCLYAMRDAKWEMLLSVFSSWPQDELQSLAEGLTRYLDDSEALILNVADQ